MSAPTAKRVDWREDAACGVDSAHLFGEVDKNDRGPNFLNRYKAARAICDGCPVKAQCLELAVSERLSGVFGGAYLSLGKVRNPSQVRSRVGTGRVSYRNVGCSSGTISEPPTCANTATALTSESANTDGRLW